MKLNNITSMMKLNFIPPQVKRNIIIPSSSLSSHQRAHNSQRDSMNDEQENVIFVASCLGAFPHIFTFNAVFRDLFRLLWSQFSVLSVVRDAKNILSINSFLR